MLGKLSAHGTYKAQGPSVIGGMCLDFFPVTLKALCGPPIINFPGIGDVPGGEQGMFTEHTTILH